MGKWIWGMTLCIAIISACNQPKTPADTTSTTSEVSPQSEFDAYLKFKRIPAPTEERRQKLFEQYLEREALADAVEKSDLLDKELIAAELSEFRKEMLISRYFETFLKTKVTDQEVQNYYNTHGSDYEQRKAHGAHILIRTNSKMGEAERKAKLTIAQEAYSKIRAGEDFGAVAEAYSEDKLSAVKGGDLGWIKEGSIDANFSTTLFALEPGEMSEPVETQFGFHLIKLIEAPQIVKQPYSAVAGNIRYQLRNQAKQAEMERLLSQIEAGLNSDPDAE